MKNISRFLTRLLLAALLVVGTVSTLSCCAGPRTIVAPPRQVSVDTPAEPVREAPPTHQACPDRPCVLRVALDGYIDADAVETFKNAMAWAQMLGPDAILVQMGSNGGDIYGGWAIMRIIRDSTVPVHCLVDPYAYSMGFAILQTCKTRGAVPGSVLMMHQVNITLSLTSVDQFKVQSELDYARALQSSLERIVSRRLGMPLRAYQAHIRQDWWMSEDEALRAHAIDYIVSGSPEAVRRIRKDLLEE